jgi:Na+/proline symporter
VAVRGVIDALRADDGPRLAAAQEKVLEKEGVLKAVRADAVRVAKASNDTNYIFLTFVLAYLPAGLVGLVLAVVFAASMSSNSAALNALASTTVVDVYGRLLRKGKGDAHYVRVSKLATVFWGLLAILFAEFSNRLGTLIEVVNILGSLFYGTILGVFLLAFYFKRVGGTATFVGAIVGEAVVVACWSLTPLAFLWYNLVGCGVTIAVALVTGAVRGEVSHGATEIAAPPGVSSTGP